MSIFTQKVTTQCTNDAEGSKQAWKEKKKSRWNWRRNQKDSTPATRVNTTDASKQSGNIPIKSDPANDMYYSCNKKAHYANKYMEPKN